MKRYWKVLGSCLSLCLAVIGARGQGTTNAISNLRAVSVSGLATGYQEQVGGYYAAGDGGGGLFIYNSASSATDNGGTIIQPTTGSGRWLRSFNGAEVAVEWFGAKGDGATNDQPAIQAAINSFPSGSGTVKLTNRTYLLNSALTISQSYMSLIGVGQVVSSLELNSGSMSGVVCGTLGGPIIQTPILQGFRVQVNPTVGTTTGAGVTLNYTALAKVSDLYIDECATSVLLQYATNSNFQRVVCLCGPSSFNYVGFCFFGGSGTNMYYAASSMYRDCVVDASSNTGTSMGFKLYGNTIADVYLDTPGTLNCNYGIYIDGSSAITQTVPYNWDIQIRHATNDQYKNYGIAIISNSLIGQVSISEGWTNPLNSSSGPGVYISNSRGVKIQGMQWMNIGRAGGVIACELSGSSNVSLVANKAVNTSFGIYLYNSSENTLQNNTVYNDNVSPGTEGSTGILLGTSSKNTVMGNVVDGYSAVGIYSDTACATNVFMGNVVNSTDVTTPHSINGSNDYADWTLRGQ